MAPSSGNAQTAPDARRRALRQFQARWILATTVALPLALLTSFAANVLQSPPLALGCGFAFLEGAFVSLLQASTLRSLVPKLHAISWIATGGLGTLASWLVVRRSEHMLSAWPSEDSAPTYVLIALGALVLLGGLRSSFQWLLLSRHLPHSWLWALANASAWLLLLPLFALTFAVGIWTEAPTVGPGALLTLVIPLALAGAFVGTLQAFVIRHMIVARGEQPVGAPQ